MPVFRPPPLETLARAKFIQKDALVRRLPVAMLNGAPGIHRKPLP